MSPTWPPSNCNSNKARANSHSPNRFARTNTENNKNNSNSPMTTMTMDDAAGHGVVLGADLRGGGDRSRGGSPHGRIALQFGGEHSPLVKNGGGGADSPRRSSSTATSNTPLRTATAEPTTTPPQTPIGSLHAKNDELDGFGVESVPQSTTRDNDELTLNDDEGGSVVLVVTSVLQSLVMKCIEMCGRDGGKVQEREMLAEEETATNTQWGASGTRMDREEPPVVGGDRLQQNQMREQGLGLVDHPSHDLREQKQGPQHAEPQLADDTINTGVCDNDDPEPNRERPPLTTATGPLLWRGSRRGNSDKEMGDAKEGEIGMKGGIAMLINNNRTNHNDDNMDELISRAPTHHAPSTPPPIVRSSPFTSSTSSPSAIALSPISIRYSFKLFVPDNALPNYQCQPHQTSRSNLNLIQSFLAPTIRKMNERQEHLRSRLASVKRLDFDYDSRNLSRAQLLR